MAAKAEIAVTTHTHEEIATILTDYTSSPLLSQRYLFGGFSGSTYLVTLASGSTFVLKISNGYSATQSELTCRTAHHLSQSGFSHSCYPLPLLNHTSSPSEPVTEKVTENNFKFVSLKETNGTPALLLTHVSGRQADKVMREHPHLANKVVNEIGMGLARMHASTTGLSRKDADQYGLRWYGTDGGCCDVADQASGLIWERYIEGCDKDGDHTSFVDFYREELPKLKEEMGLVEDGTLEIGITHGDPFADNVMVDEATGELEKFIDIEDYCVGPLLFDLACCVIGCCFRSVTPPTTKDRTNKQVMDVSFFEALLTGYCTQRRLPDVEIDHLLPFMRLALLCNCTWRFVNFNFKTKDAPEDVRGAYLELQHRVEYLNDSQVILSLSNSIRQITETDK